MKQSLWYPHRNHQRVVTKLWHSQVVSQRLSCFESPRNAPPGTHMVTALPSQVNLTKLITWTTALSNSMKLWVMPCRATQDGQVMVESSDKTWSTGEGNGKPLQYFCLENPMNGMKKQKDRTLKDELPRSVGSQYALEKSGKITPERTKQWSQSKNNTQL